MKLDVVFPFSTMEYGIRFKSRLMVEPVSPEFLNVRMLSILFIDSNGASAQPLVRIAHLCH